MGLFDEIKDKLTGKHDEAADAAEAQAPVVPEEQARIDREEASNEATAAAAEAKKTYLGW